MAYLNVRERRIEAKIAYVGPELSGKGTNLDQLKHVSSDARIAKVETSSDERGSFLSLAWADTGRFRDCSVRVNVVEQQGAVSEQSFRDVMRDTDGVVVVVDAAPDARTRNQASLATVREVLAREARREIPVVLQVNKSDLPDALSAEEVVASLDSANLVHVVASATQGEGVIETLETLLNQVFDALQAERPKAAPDVEGNTAPPDGQEGHPLLDALRQVLRETAQNQIAELESRLVKRLDRAFTRLEERLAAVELRSAAIEKKVATTDARVVAVDRALTTGPERASKEDLVALSARLDRLREELESATSRIVDGRGRADREHLSLSTAGIKKSIDSVAMDIRTTDVRPRLGEVAELVSRVVDGTATLSTQLARANDVTQALAARIDQIELSLRQRGARTEDALLTLRGETTEHIGATEKQFEAVLAQVGELVEELKKPKRGWFA